MICTVNWLARVMEFVNMNLKEQKHTPNLPGLFLLFLIPCCLLMSLEVPLEFHGGGIFGKYLNSDTTLFNLDASIELYCVTLRHGPVSAYIYYRDDLDMAEQTGGVSIDPRYVHYYIVGGMDFFWSDYVITGYFVHDCVHDIDYDVEGTPVFNRFRVRFSPKDFHFTRRLSAEKRFLWSADLGFYPHWDYHGWDINAGADYQYDLIMKGMFNLYSTSSFGVNLRSSFTVAKGDTTYYHQHLIGLEGYYRKIARRIGLRLDYNIYNNDPIKSPDKLWLLSLYLEF
jgi:hypothetical protein